MFGFDLQSLLYGIPAILVALVFHEFSHGFVATMLGDETPRLTGRLSLNPLRHLDPIGTIMMVFAGFGWAKPVMVNPIRFRGNRKFGMLLVALAGPMSNLLLALFAGFFLNIIGNEVIPYNPYFFEFFNQLLMYNVMLAAFNIIPIPPLDGSKVLAMILPNKWSEKIYMAGQYSMIILVLLSVSGVLGYILRPIANGMLSFIGMITGIM